MAWRREATGSSKALEVGDTAPDFTLRRTFEASVTLSDLLADGPVVLVFYVFDFGEYWGRELSQLGQRTEEIRELGAEPVAVAVTATFSQIAFSQSLGADFAMLSDWDGEVSAAYGAQYDVWKDHVGLAKRTVFLIDPTLTIRYRWQTEDALVLPDLDEVVEALRSLRA